MPRIKSPVTRPGIDTETFLAQRLDHYATPGPLPLSVLRDICKGLNRTGANVRHFYGHNDVSSYCTATGNLVLFSHALESCGCDAVLLETASDISYGATASVFGTEWQEIGVATASHKGICFSVLFTLYMYVYMVRMTGRYGDKSTGWDRETSANRRSWLSDSCSLLFTRCRVSVPRIKRVGLEVHF
jgi:hypothetical protein